MLKIVGNIILIDLLPIFITIALGWGSGKLKAFSGENARSMNKLALNYALPAALFVSIVQSNRSALFSDWKVVVISLVLIIGIYFWSYFSLRKFFHHTKAEAAVGGLIGGAPTIGYLGLAVLVPIFGNNATTGLVVAIVAIVVNAITIPISLVLLNPQGDTVPSEEAATAKPASGNISMATATGTPAAAAATAGGATAAVAVAKPKKQRNAFVNAIIEPVVWAPLLAVILVLVGVKFPAKLDPSLNLIGKCTSGLACFAAGLTISTYKFRVSKEIFYNCFIKLIVMPALMLIVGKLMNMDALKLQMLVLCGALPPVFSGIIIGSRYQIYVKNGTNSLAVSVVLFMATAPLWIWLSKIVATMHW